MNWIWDGNKNEQNFRSHGIGFETAIKVFDDPFAVTIKDPNREELRWRTMELINTVTIVVVHTWPEYVDHQCEEGNKARKRGL